MHEIFINICKTGMHKHILQFLSSLNSLDNCGTSKHIVKLSVLRKDVANSSERVKKQNNSSLLNSCHAALFPMNLCVGLLEAVVGLEMSPFLSQLVLKCALVFS